jgi:ribonuclease D
VEAVGEAPVVGFDTEFVGEASYEPQLCLIQVSTADCIYLVDPLARLDLREFWSALTAPGREVTAFAARQELLFCQRYGGRLPENVFDPQLAAGLLGFGYPVSHTNLVKQLLGVQLAGSEAYTDWRRRPLSKQQLEYAADDVRYLLEARRLLTERARTMGRLDWLASEFTELAKQATDSDRRDEWWRAAGSSKLAPRKRAVLRELWAWRDKRARQVDLPPRRLLRDDVLVEIARRSPQRPAELHALRGMERPALRRETPDILAAVRVGMEVPEAELPKQPELPEDPPQVAALGQLLAVLTNTVAAESQVAPALLATTADLQAFVRWHLGLTDGTEPPAVLAGWRGEVLGRSLVELLEGQRIIRVVDAGSPNPLRIERIADD